MHAALLANTAWLDEELATLRHLVVGLIDEQVRVAQVVPTRSLAEDLSVFGEQITWRETGRSRWLKNRRITALDRTLQTLGVDVIHALDGRLWEPAARLAEELDLAAIFSANSSYDVPQAPRIARRVNPARTAFTAATAPLAEAIRPRLDPAQVVELLPPGVHVPHQDPEPRNPDRPLCLVITGNGRRDEAYDALLPALRDLIDDHPDTHIFFDGQGAAQHAVWKSAYQLGLMGQASFVPRRLGHRELLLRADALVMPQALGRARSLTLQAFAAGLPVLAQLDPWLDYQVHDQTAWLLDHPDSQQWAQQLRRLIDEPAAAAELGRSARDWVRAHRLASTQVGQVLNVYRAVTGTALPFRE